MAIARSCLVNDDIEGTYHCISRIVRRAFLCGWDALTQQNYEHRKVWISGRLQELAGIFAIDVCGYAVMDNHLLCGAPHKVCYELHPIMWSE